MRWLALTLLGALLCGCTTYSERFTYIDPATQTTNAADHRQPPTETLKAPKP